MLVTMKEMFAAYGVSNEADLIKAKTDLTKRQSRVFVDKKPALVNMTADECKKACEKQGIEYLSGYESRVLKYKVSNEAKDSYGDKVRAKGADFKRRYNENPVIQWSHNYDLPPIGNSIKHFYDKDDISVKSHGLFADDRVDKSGLADSVFQLARSGFMKACSVGFMPLTYKIPETSEEAEKMGLGPNGVDFLTWEMLEWSPCSIPANPEALNNMIKEIGVDALPKFEKSRFDVIEKFGIFENKNALDAFVEAYKPKKTIVTMSNDNNDLVKSLEDINTTIKELKEDIKTVETKLDENNKNVKGLFELLEKEIPGDSEQTPSSSEDKLYTEKEIEDVFSVLHK